MHKVNPLNKPLALLILLALALAACSPEETASQTDEAPPDQSAGFQAEAGPPLAVVAGNPINLSATAYNGELASCAWTIVTPSPRFNEDDAGRVLSEACDATIPGDFTAERTGLWTVELTAMSANGETATDQVDIRVTPNTVNLLILGYIIIFGVGMIFIGSMAWRARTLRRDAAALAALVEEDVR